MVVPALLLTAVVGGSDSRLLPKIDLREWRRMVGRILPYSAAVVLAVVYFQIAQILVSVLSSPAQTGYFGVSFRVLAAFTTVPGLLVSTALPLLARTADDDRERFSYASRRLAETMLIAGCGVALGLCLGAGFAIRLIAGSGFGPSIDVLRILAFALLGTFVINARGYALLSLDRLRAMLLSNGAALVVVAAAGVPLIIAYGAKGAAIAMVVAEFTLALCYEWALSSERPELRLASGFALRAAAAMVLAGAVALALGLSSLASAVVGLALYIAALLGLGIVPAEIRHALLPRRRATAPRS
jgi:O-antigen/teichoic acid export membrane protein